MSGKKRVYVAGPISKGDQAENVRRAVEVGDELWRLGYVPYIPHLTWFWHLLHHHEYEEWVAYSMEWLRVCHALLRISGESAGADREVIMAAGCGIPCFYRIEDLLREYPP